MSTKVETICDSCGLDITHASIVIWQWHTLCAPCYAALEAGKPQPPRVDNYARPLTTSAPQGTLPTSSERTERRPANHKTTRPTNHPPSALAVRTHSRPERAASSFRRP